MYHLIATWTIFPGHEPDAFVGLKKLAISVQQNEPDTLTYLIHIPDVTQNSQPASHPLEVIFFEIYKDEAAFVAHTKGPSFTNFLNDYGKFFEQSQYGPFTSVLFLEHRVGFIRGII